MTKRVLPLWIFLMIIMCLSPILALPEWVVELKGNDLQIYYSDFGWPIQCASLDLESSYFRLVFSPYSGWGTSVIILPSFWEEYPSWGYHQSGHITEYSYATLDTNLIINFTGVVSGLTISGFITIYQPKNFNILVNPASCSPVTAKVEVTDVQGDITIQDKPYEAFKPMMVSSMHISDTYYDAKTVFAYQRMFFASTLGKRNYTIPLNMWLLPRTIVTRYFGTEGGNSQWQADNNQGTVPTITITLDKYYPVQGWVTFTDNPNWDNIGFWPSSDSVLSSWSYFITASNPNVIPRIIRNPRPRLRLR